MTKLLTRSTLLDLLFNSCKVSGETCKKSLLRGAAAGAVHKQVNISRVHRRNWANIPLYGFEFKNWQTN